MTNASTIAAISTPAGSGGIAVIRVSGKDAFGYVSRIFVPKKKDLQLTEKEANSVVFGSVVTDKGETIDDVLVTLFRSPHSFTGEDTIEISCHGSVFIQQQILKLLLKQGCELARPGEFSQRAFLNGKMDLSQAEAVADLIASTSAASHRMALSQMRGNFSNELTLIREKLLNFVSLIELELDFNEEDVEFADRKELNLLAKEIEEKISKLADSFNLGNVLKNGIPVALVGETNVGKSTLLNLFLNEEKAIVSDIHGTTRDVIEDSVNINGVMFRFIDTAGIRETKDKIENLGIERTYKKIEQASIILWLIDSTQVSEHIEWLTERIAKRAVGKKVILVFNKIDKIDEEEYKVLDELFDQFDAERIYISAKERINTEELETALLKAAQIPELQATDVVVNNVRHYEALTKAQTSIQRVIDGLENNISHDFLSQDIRECMHFLGEITGQISTDEILGNIFSKFCIGK
ncbi:tRNA uridine-5-carboxymethylaminomethyl(34) synthesis GTPase MnmE [Paludibacter sp. 221]|uniref:tRNA uridine-5-carboxymethylaminomethyl(34) synthesis GTPase MnmE n=1 Tax=Paludibacter sp. 221 TaxID=2302939 RepID=UPI0013D08271|nr:tRNA uridine-5-carboxymethylaminomethyl(34) synthesis GTPase MnmE [Paludibacter sp. 221]NDV45874.1 tRNA uridine-5-carboxymethylaminomethyl(34) synthesis GTPase MnmE [Paludibacter sp. 221]